MDSSEEGSFVFDASSDDESSLSSDDNKTIESAWDFGAYSEAVAAEHARRNTTSVDQKIQKLRQIPSVSLINKPGDDSDASSSDSDTSDSDSDASDSDSDASLPNKQEDEKEEDEEKEEVVEEDEEKPFFSTANGVSFRAKSFMELNLSRPLLRACEALGYTKPTPIQAACVPFGMAGRDICASAITGSGKTAAFALPTLERLLYRPKRTPAIRVLILTPTRELAAQVHSMIEKLAKFTDIRCCLIVGGLSTKVQEAALRSMPDIVVATPGRMIDHLRNSMSVDLDDLAVLILDEADRLLELGFSAEIQELVRMCSKKRQTMLFSATMTEEVNDLVKLSLKNPLRISADPSSQRPASLIEEVVRIRRTRESHQEAVLLALCSKTFTSKVIVFSGTKAAAHRLKILFGLAGLKAAEIHGYLTQAQRLESLELFKKQEVDFLIATNVAARGLDIVGVKTVINFACPRDFNTYVHRVGRTARAGRGGCAVTFVTDNDRSLLKAIAKKAGSKLKSRIVNEQSINKWVQIIDEMEDQVATILREEQEEMELRKAEMEALKAENLIEHREEIFSRPKRTWFMTPKEKKLMEKEMKASLEKGKVSGNDVVSAKKAEELKMKEKRKQEREKNLPRKKRRKLEAEREMLEEENDSDNPNDEEKKRKKDKSGIPLVDVAYCRAKAMKSGKKLEESGKKLKKMGKKATQPQSRTEEMRELFQTDMSDRRLKKTHQQVGKKSSFKSKSRYKRRK